MGLFIVDEQNVTILEEMPHERNTSAVEELFQELT